MASYIIPGFYNTGGSGGGGGGQSAPIFLATELPVAIGGQEYSAKLNIKGTEPITVTCTSTLPGGLSFDANTITISGTPSETGNFTLNFSATNQYGTTTKSYSLQIVTLPEFTTTTLPDAYTSMEYSQEIKLSGTTPITLSISDGALPNGISLNTDTHKLVGFATTEGSYSFELTATNIGGSATQQFTMEVVSNVPVFLTESLPNGVVGVAYTTTTIETGGYPPVTVSIDSGSSLPAGLSNTGSSGTVTISGTPTDDGTTSVAMTATNSEGSTNKTYAIVVTPNPNPVITTASLPNGKQGDAYNQALSASGGGTQTWSIASGNLPTGMNITSAGVISGTPTVVQTATFTVQVNNTAGVGTKEMSITVESSAPVVTTASINNGTYGQAFSQQLEATNGPDTWSITNGNLLPGLTLNSSGLLSGTPAGSGDRTITVQAENEWGTDTAEFTMHVDAILPTIETDSLPNGTYNSAYSQTLSYNGGGAVVTWSVTDGALPTGMQIVSDTGVINGIPTVAGSFAFTVGATNTVGTTEKEFTLVVDPIAPVINTATLPGGTIGTPYSQTLSANTGGASSVTWATTTGTPPAGLSLDGATGVISGTPTTAETATFTVSCTNSAGSDTQELSITISGVAPSITTSTLPEGVVGEAYNATVAATGTAPITFATTSTLPDGVTFTNGVFAGAPTAEFSGTVTVTATNAYGEDNATLALTITAAPATG